MNKRRYWLATVSKEHVERGKAGGFAQVCHGKCAPLKRMQAGDILIYYSPQLKFGEKTPYQCFSAIGSVAAREPHQFEMSSDFIPFRRDVNYFSTQDASIKPLIQQLSFIKDKIKWGYVFRFGIIEIYSQDFEIIAAEMKVSRETINELCI